MSEPANAPVSPGQVLAGKYRIERVLGQGGMGIVVSATHLQLGERVALKFLLKDATLRPEIVARFLREAQAAVRIKSEHVARIIDVGTLEQGEPYMVMEFLSGRDLSQILEARGPLPADVAIEYVLQACEAIAEAHALGIVHRDLKPANLFVSRRADGTHIVKVLDFGISKATAPDGPHGSGMSLTATTGGVMGSPLYMSPEQVRSAKKVDPRADVWSLGVILHELISGEPPFMAETMTSLLAAIMVDAPTRLRERVPTASVALEGVVLRCLEKDITKRFANVAELADALAPFAPNARLSVDRISRVLRRAPVAGTVSASSDPFDFPGRADTEDNSSRTFDPPPRLSGTQPLAVSTRRLGSRPSLEPTDPTLLAGSGAAPVAQTETSRGWGKTQPDSAGRVSEPRATGVVAAVVLAVAGLSSGTYFALRRPPSSDAPSAATAPALTPPPPQASVAGAAPAPVASASAQASPVTTSSAASVGNTPTPKGKTGALPYKASGGGPPVSPPPVAPTSVAPPPQATPGRGDF